MGNAKLIPQPCEITFETKLGQLVIDRDEYLVIKENNREDKLMITKKGVQKIEDFFNIEIDRPLIDQQFVNNANFNIIVTIHAISKHGSAYGVASANRFNLTTPISCQFATEMAVKRARATAALEIMRKNCVKTETLMLLYSSFDEFNAEIQLNNQPSSQEPVNGNNQQKTETNKANETKANNKANETNVNNKANNTGVSNDVKKNDTPKSTNAGTTDSTKVDDASKENKEPTNPITPQFKEADFKAPMITKKYLEGITIDEIFKTDKPYLKLMANEPNPRRDFVNAYLLSINKTSADL